MDRTRNNIEYHSFLKTHIHINEMLLEHPKVKRNTMLVNDAIRVAKME